MNDEGILAAVINWNGWRDTLACLDSMRDVAAPRFELVICDNGSSDESIARLVGWAANNGFEPVAPLGAHRDAEAVRSFRAPVSVRDGALQALHLLALRRNFGYAGAINRCIEWGRATLAPGCYWFLNNDIKVDASSLQRLVDAVRASPRIGLCGSVLLEWDEPERVQAIGGILHRPIAVGTHMKALPAGIPPDSAVFYGVDYPIGASLLATREFIEQVGAMDEGYFLYYEEVDWAERGRARGFRPAVALQSRIRHKEGASTGSGGSVRNKSLLSEYYSIVNRLRFTGKFSPWRVPGVWLSLFLVVLDRVLHREWKRAALVLRLMFRPRSVPRP